MMSISKYIKSLFCCFMMLVADTTGAQVVYAPVSADDPVQISGLKADHVGEDLYIRFNFNISRIKVKSEKQISLTPVLKNGVNRVVLPGVVIAGHNRYVRLRRSGGVPECHTLYRSGHVPSSLAVDVHFPFEPWMLSASLVVEDTLSGCNCRPIRSEEYAAATLGVTINENVTNVMERLFHPEYVYITPAVEIEKIRSAEGHAYVDFPLNETKIYPNYRKNPIELANIRDTIEMIKNDPDYIITSITLRGYASPEGPYDNNVRLAQGRTEALSEYIRSFYDFSPKIMHTSWQAEDWQGLIKWLENSSIANRNALLTIAKSPKYDDDADRREWILKSSYPDQYKWLLANVYPSLRHTDYTITYSVKTFTSIEELKVAWAQEPRKMSLIELYLLATSYAAGSLEFVEIFETAAALFPNSTEANLNAAVSSLQNGDLLRAERYLRKAGDSPEAVYARGILAAEKGDIDEALSLFESATSSGIYQAKEAALQLQSSRH